MARKINILSVLESDKFPPFLFKELARSAGTHRKKSGKAVLFYVEHKDMLIPALKSYVECELNKLPFSRDGFNKRDMRSLHDFIFLPAVGHFLDRNKPRANRPTAMPVCITKYLKQ